LGSNYFKVELDIYDICSHFIPEMSKEFILHAKEVQNKLGYFKNPTISHNKDYRKEDFKEFGLW
tara:strand:- start:8042 stop:8233 length:192 start_codon:yes stop_codon:yes gene_type:complete